MQSFLWTLVIVALTTLVYARRKATTTHRSRFAVNELAIIVLIVGTHSIAVRGSAANVLAEPLIAETIIRGAMAGLAILLVVPSIAGKRSRLGISQTHGLVALNIYGVVAVASIAYSAAPLPTAGKALELGAGLLVAWSFVTRPDPETSAKEAIKLIVIVEGALLAVAVVGFFIVPTWFAELDSRPGFVSEMTMVAPFASSNGLSASGGLIAVYSIVSIFVIRRRQASIAWVAMFAVSTLAIVLASGRQGVAIWLVSVAIALWVHRRRQLILLIAPAAIFLITTNWAELLEILSRNQASVNISSLSGRTNYWQAAFDAWQAHPWTGYGFGAGGRFVALARLGADSISSVHGGFFEALVGVGILGLIPLLLAIGIVGGWSIRNLAAPRFARETILIVPLLLHTTVSNGIGAWLNSEVLVFMLMAVLVGATAHLTGNLDAPAGEEATLDEMQSASRGPRSSS